MRTFHFHWFWPYYSLLSQVLRELQFNLRSHSTFHHSTQPTSWWSRPCEMKIPLKSLRHGRAT